MGYPAPNFMAISISLAEASPRSIILIASAMYGTSNLLTTNPGVSLHVMHVLPTALPHDIIAWYVSSDVWGILTTSNSFITGTGLKKCKPPNLSLLLVTEAISPMLKELVLEAKIVLAGAASSNALKSLCFTAMFSTIASTTRSASETEADGSVEPLMRDWVSLINFWAAVGSSLYNFLATLETLFPIFPSAFFNNSGFTSTRVTLWPVCAATCVLSKLLIWVNWALFRVYYLCNSWSH